MEIACLEVSTQKHIDQMQETVKVKYMQYGKGAKGRKCKPKTNGNSGGGGSSANAEECNGSNASAGEAKSKGKKPPLPTTSAGGVEKQDTRKARSARHLSQPAGIVESRDTMRKCAWRNQPPSQCSRQFQRFWAPLLQQTWRTCLCADYAVQVNARNRNQHLIQLPVSVNLEKVRKQMEKCPTILLKIDTGADVNLLNSTIFDQVIGNRSILQPSSLKMENYGSSRIVVLGKFFAFVRWKGKIYRQPYFVTMANTSPNLLSRDACYTLGVVKPCYAVEAERSIYMQICKQIYKAHGWQICKQIYRNNMWWISNVIYKFTDHKYTALKHCIDCQMRNRGQIWFWDRDLPSVLKQRSKHNYRHSGQLRGPQFIRDYQMRNTDRDPGVLHKIQHRSTGKSTVYFRSTTKSTRSLGSTTWSATRFTLTVRKQPPMTNPVANTVDSISHAHFRSSFQTEVERKQMRQIQDRGTHNYRQKDPEMQMDLQSNLQVDLQKDLQDLQVKMDLQPDLQVRTGLEGTQHSPLVSFQAETSTERENLGGTCEQGPNHVSGEFPHIYNKDLHPTWIYNRDLHPTQIYNRDLHPKQIYKTHHLTGHTSKLQAMLSHPEHPALPMGNPVTQSVWLILQFQMQCLTVNGIVSMCPTMCIIVWPQEPSGEGLSCYQCIGKMWWLFLFRQIDCVEIYNGFSYGTVCAVKLINHLDRTD